MLELLFVAALGWTQLDSWIPEHEVVLVHEVASGDTAIEIAEEHGIEVGNLMAVNPIEDPNLLHVGQELVVSEPLGRRPVAPLPSVSPNPPRAEDAPVATQVAQPSSPSEDEPAPAPTTEQGSEPEPEPVPPTSSGDGVWYRLADCESGNWIDGGASFEPGSARWNWGAPGMTIPPWGTSLHHGGLQFHPGTWDAYRLDGFPQRAYDASPAQQIAVGERVLAAQSWRAWPTCAAKLGLR